MHQSILMHTDIDEGAEGCYVGDHAFQYHVRAQILDVFHAVLEGRGGEFRTRITAWFFQLFQDVGDSRYTEFFIGIARRIQALQQTAVTDDGLHIFLYISQDFFYQRIGFRMDGRGVERIAAIHHAQEASSLFKGLVTQAWHGAQIGACAEHAFGIAVIDYALCDARGQAGNPRQ